MFTRLAEPVKEAEQGNRRRPPTRQERRGEIESVDCIAYFQSRFSTWATKYDGERQTVRASGKRLVSALRLASIASVGLTGFGCLQAT